jgi:hypothetical protein
LDFALVTALIFFLWLAAKKTKKLLRRLEPEEQNQVKREMIIIKAGFTSASHLPEPDEPAATEEPVAVAAAGLPEPAFEVEAPKPAAAPAEKWKEISWEPSSEPALSAH